MAILLLQFRVPLQRHGIRSRHRGPLFHRWLPNGKQDAITLDAQDSNTTIKIWFEQRGYVNSGIIEYDPHRQEIDPTIINKQGVIDSGTLWGSIEIKELSEKEVTALEENKIGDPNYITLGKKVINKLIYPTVTKFLNILRIHYGQYWLYELEKWDSRKQTLGAYCHFLGLSWSFDNGNTWSEFLPNKTEHYGIITIPSNEQFKEYLTEEDWKDISSFLKEDYEPPLAAFAFARTHQFLAEKNLKNALIEGGITLELAISDFVRQRLKKDNKLKDFMNRFFELSLTTQVTTLATFTPNISLENINQTIQAITMRNKVMHEGYEPTSLKEVQEALSGLQKIVICLLKGPNFKFPNANTGNKVLTPEEWEKNE